MEALVLFQETKGYKLFHVVCHDVKQSGLEMQQ